MAAAPQKVIGIIGGSGLRKSDLLRGATSQVAETKHGDVVVHVVHNEGARIVFVQRHAADPVHEYTLPHLVNYAAIAAALKDLGCVAVIGFNSVGTMHPTTIPLAAIIVPNDFACPWDIRTAISDDKAHVIVRYDQGLRVFLMKVLAKLDLQFGDGGVYVNARGPRFETPAEIRLLALFGDVVGMTGAHEATAFGELGIPYACVCIVDNLANGTGPFTTADFHRQQAINAPVVERMVRAVMESPAGAVEAAEAARAAAAEATEAAAAADAATAAAADAATVADAATAAAAAAAAENVVRVDGA